MCLMHFNPGAWRITDIVIGAHYQRSWESIRASLSEYEAPVLCIHVLHSEDGNPLTKVQAFANLVVENLEADKLLN